MDTCAVHSLPDQGSSAPAVLFDSPGGILEITDSSFTGCTAGAVHVRNAESVTISGGKITACGTGSPASDACRFEVAKTREEGAEGGGEDGIGAEWEVQGVIFSELGGAAVCCGAGTRVTVVDCTVDGAAEGLVCEGGGSMDVANTGEQRREMP